MTQSLTLWIEAVERAFSLTARIPVWGRLQGAIVDSLLGPAEDFEYVSTTAPSSYPADYIS